MVPQLNKELPKCLPLKVPLAGLIQRFLTQKSIIITKGLTRFVSQLNIGHTCTLCQPSNEVRLLQLQEPSLFPYGKERWYERGWE